MGWKSRSLWSTVFGLALAAGAAGLAVHDAPTAHAQDASRQMIPLEVQAMQQLADGVGWAADQGHLMWTRDHGQRWTDLTPATLGTDRIQRAFFRTEREGWLLTAPAAGGALAVQRTQDGGASWTSHAVVSLPDGGSPSALEFTDAMTGWVMVQLSSSANFTSGRLLATTDGGQRWTALPTPPTSGAVHFTSRTTGWLAGGPAHDQLFATRDGGLTWTRQVLPAPASVASDSHPVTQLPKFTTATDGVLPITYTGATSSVVVSYVTADGGATWRSRSTVVLPDRDGHVSASAVDADTVIVAPSQSSQVIAMAGGMQHSFRSGNLSDQQAIVDVDFQSADRGWLTVASGQCAAGKSQCTEESKLFTTTDGGRTMHDITPMVTAPPATITPDSVFLSVGKGFDQCAAGTVSQMQAWFTNTPWSFANAYIGGANRGCGQANLTASWVKSVLAQGWFIVPTWVGPQAPGSSCTSCSQMSSNTTTARQQGINEANAAANEMSTLGFPMPSIVYYDMERYDPTSNAAAKAFVGGWVSQLAARGLQAGVYGAGANAAADWATATSVPQAVWIANFNGVDGTTGLTGLPDTDWDHHQRIHQFQGGHNETWGGVTFNIDTSRADGPVADN